MTKQTIEIEKQTYSDERVNEVIIELSDCAHEILLKYQSSLKNIELAEVQLCFIKSCTATLMNWLKKEDALRTHSLEEGLDILLSDIKASVMNRLKEH